MTLKCTGLPWVCTILFLNRFVYSNVILVLHPQNKLRYFKELGWEPLWIETALTIVRERWETTYKNREVLPRRDSLKVPFIDMYLMLVLNPFRTSL